jgi:hypothetical protein
MPENNQKEYNKEIKRDAEMLFFNIMKYVIEPIGQKRSADLFKMLGEFLSEYEKRIRNQYHLRRP